MPSYGNRSLFGRALPWCLHLGSRLRTVLTDPQFEIQGPMRHGSRTPSRPEAELRGDSGAAHVPETDRLGSVVHVGLFGTGIRGEIWTRLGQRMRKPWERCESGRIGLTANELTWVTGSEGSNPSLSARAGQPAPWPKKLERPATRACRPRRPGGVRPGARRVREVVDRFFMQTLGCPKNQVDSDKLEGYLETQGYGRVADPAEADLVVVNTCAFIQAAPQESIDTGPDLP